MFISKIQIPFFVSISARKLFLKLRVFTDTGQGKIVVGSFVEDDIFIIDLHQIDRLKG